jgi:hypothetical protein
MKVRARLGDDEVLGRQIDALTRECRRGVSQARLTREQQRQAVLDQHHRRATERCTLAVQHWT